MKKQIDANDVQFSLSGFWDDLTYNLKRGSGSLFRYIVNRNRWNTFSEKKRVLPFPDHVDIEISTACNMRCPMCYTITDDFKKRVKSQFMKPELFYCLIDECAAHNIYSIRLSLRGEPFIHPHVKDFIKYAKDKGIKEVSSLTNGLAIDEEFFESLLELGLDWLIISFDGLGTVYENIRKPAKFDRAYEKIKNYAEIKKKKNSIKPVIKIQGVWPAVKENTKEFLDAFKPYADQVVVNPLTDYLDYDKDIIYKENFSCPTLYQRLVVSADGRALLCANDEKGEHIIGDTNNDSLYDIWHGDEMQKVRNAHCLKEGFKEFEVCRKCHLPRAVQKEKLDIQGLKVETFDYKGREGKGVGE